MQAGIFFLIKMKNAFNNIPFFRILIPFILGILLGIYSILSAFSIVYFAAIFVLVILINLKKIKPVLLKRFNLILLDFFFLLLGVNLVSEANLISHKSYYGNYLKSDSAVTFIATVSDLPIKRERFMKCFLKVNEVKTNSGFKKARGNLIGYFKISLGKNQLKVGSSILFKANLSSIDPPKNPFEFDYKTYLFHKQIYHTVFVDSLSYKVLDIPLQLNKVWYRGLLFKNYILQKLKNSNLSTSAYGICAALLTGYDDEIDKSVIESFSHSGTLHVLSVSGLHTGLIYLVLSFLYDLVDRKRKHVILKFVIITFLLWGFALITGFSAPVLRAVIMFNLLGFGKIFFRSNYQNQLNILLVSAFILLSYNPFYITDVGFLLSYFAMFGLLYYQPKLSSIWRPKKSMSTWLWQGVTASFAATISTLPLTLFYFKQFPLWFFICNIIVVPASFIILLLSLLIILNVGYVAIVINTLVKFLVKFISFFNSSKFGFIDNIDFNFYDAFFLAVLIIFITIAIQCKSYKFIVSSLALLIWWQIISLFVSGNLKTQSLFAVYQINKNNNYVIKNKVQSTINELDSSVFLFHIKSHIISFNNTVLSVKNYNYIRKDNKQILILNKKNYWPDISLRDINFLLISNNFKLKEADFVLLKSLKTIILDGSNNSFSIRKTEELCRKFDIELIKTKQTGAYILNL